MAYLRSVHVGHLNVKLRCDPEQALHDPRPRPSMRIVVVVRRIRRRGGKTGSLIMTIHLLPLSGRSVRGEDVHHRRFPRGEFARGWFHHERVRLWGVRERRDVGSHGRRPTSSSELACDDYILQETDRLRPSVYRHASAVLLLFNLIDRSTFTSLRDKVRSPFPCTVKRVAQGRGMAARAFAS